MSNNLNHLSQQWVDPSLSQSAVPTIVIMVVFPSPATVGRVQFKWPQEV